MRLPIAALCLLSWIATAAADPVSPPVAPPPDTTPPVAAPATPPAPGGHKMTLAEVTQNALTGPRARMATGDRDAAAAQVAEADALRYPTFTGTAFGTASPKIDCAGAPIAGNPGSACTTTEPTNFAFNFSGVFVGAELDVTQPLYTFGKIGHARGAARDGLAAQTALQNEAAGDLAVDAARAYWGVKLSREIGDMLDDGIEQITKAMDDMDERAKTKKGDTSIIDRQRVAVLLATARAQRVDAAQGEAAALAGLRAITGVADADLDDSVLASIDRKLPGDHGAQTIASAPDKRPQSIAARAGAKAADELAGLSASYYWPDLAVVGSALVSDAQGVQDPPGAFWNNPYNREGAALLLALRWNIAPWTTKARTDRARAEAHKQHAQADLAAIGASYDAASALAEAQGAHDKLEATATGEKAARTWLAAVLQDEAIGTAESRDLADAYIAWFQMRAQWAAAVFQWNVAVVRLDRATGEFHGASIRP